MNISIVNHYAVPPSESFGTRHFSLARELSRRGHRPTIFASSFRHGLPSSDQNKSPHLTKYDSAEVQGVRFVWIPTPSYSGNGMGRLWNMMRFEIGRASC